MEGGGGGRNLRIGFLTGRGIVGLRPSQEIDGLWELA